MTLKLTRTPKIWDPDLQIMKTVTVEIDIDVDELAKVLAARTNRSKHGKACAYGKVIVAKQKKEPTE